MLLKQCARCKCMIVYPASYCDSCQPIVAAQTKRNKAKCDRNHNRNRNPAHIKFYKSPEWETLRTVKLRDEKYKCEDCRDAGNEKVFAEEVHHIVTLDDDWSLRLTYSNLRALCIKCHNKRHGRFC